MISIHALREEGDDGANPEENQQWHFYPRPPRGGRPSAEAGATVQKGISIHALREEGDAQRWTKRSLVIRFLSTPSARRATLPGGDQIWPGEISIHALREEGDDYFAPSSGLQGHFYPRPPRGGRHEGPDVALSADKFLSTPSARRATAKTETKSLFSYKLYNILHEFRRALIYNGSKNDPNHAKRLENPVRRCRKDAENSPFAPGRETQNNSRPSCSKGG